VNHAGKGTLPVHPRFVLQLHYWSLQNKSSCHLCGINPQHVAASIYDSLISKEKTLAVIGLGYVGLPIALAFAKKIKVLGFDINQERVDMMRRGEDPSGELSPEEFHGCDIEFTANAADLKNAHFFIIGVPTPIDVHNNPDLRPVHAASRSVGRGLKEGDYVVYESTVYPGCTEEECIPILEEESGLKFRQDFKVGYSPERINPGDKEHMLHNTIKIVSGCDPESLDEISKVYSLVVEAGLHKASSMKVAEAAKIIENTQRDLNIALMNELSIIFNRMGINTYDVIEAAGTKWNFLKFTPGLVGGHCIGVDPYYLTYKASELGYHSKVILSGRFVNDSMGGYIAKQAIKKIIKLGVVLRDAKVLVLGVTFKENVEDIRNSKVADLVKEMKEYGLNVHVSDPYADSDEVMHEYGFGLQAEWDGPYDCVILAVNHNAYKGMVQADYEQLLTPNGLLVDVKGVLKNKVKELNYWSL